LGRKSWIRRQVAIATGLLALLGCDPEAGLQISGAATAAPDVHSFDPLEGCPQPRSAPPAHIFYVDPAHGDMKNNGSSAAPWRTLEEVVKAGLISTRRYAGPYRPGMTLAPQNPGGVVKSGDLIYLRTGNHGAVSLLGALNEDFITIAAENGQTPVLTNLRLAGAAKWIFRGLTVQNNKVKLVEFLNHDFLGPTTDIVFEGNHVLSQPDVSAWGPKDWLAQASELGVDDRASCVILRGNKIENLKNGIGIAGDNQLVEGNAIDNFGDDAIDINASRIALVRNRITNNHALGDENHNDGIQGWNFKPEPHRDILIEANTIILKTDPNLPFPGSLQGISVYDGAWENMRIVNNVIITDAWNGIGLFGIRGLAITNNTVIGTRPAVTTWIRVSNRRNTEGGAPPENVVIHNNIATKLALAKSGVVEHHNIVGGDPASLFATFDIPHAKYDLHLAPRSAAKGVGSHESAPETDIAGRRRAGPIDAGAYAATEGK
jgi:hypothetical protein